MNIKELKSCARKTLKRNYFKTLIVVFIFTVIVGGGYTFSSKIEVPRYVKKRPEVVFVSNVLEKRKSVSDIIEDIISDTNGDKKEYKYTRGVIAPFVNNMVESNSVVCGVPARRIKSIYEYKEKNMNNVYPTLGMSHKEKRNFVEKNIKL